VTDAVTHVPLANMRVLIAYQAPSRIEVVASIKTDAAGRYSFRGLKSFEFFPWASDPEGWHVALMTGGDTAVPPGGVKTVDMALDPAGKLTGRVLLPGGAGAAGVQVQAHTYVRSSDWQGWEPGETVKTAADGTYAIGGIPPGDARLGITDLPLWRYARTFYGGALTPETAASLLVVAAAATTVPDITLSAERGSIRGVVRDIHGTPLNPADAAVYLLHPDPEIGYLLVADDYAAVDGSYHVDGLPYGDYVVSFNGQMQVPNLPMWYEDDPFCLSPKTVTVRPTGTLPASVDAALPLPSHIRGTVRAASGGDLAPLEGAFVTVLAPDPDGPSDGWRDVMSRSTDAAGVYDLLLPAGIFRLRFDGPDESWASQYWNAVGDITVATSIVVGEEADLAGYDAVLAPAGP
jgi:hypothetical protein